MTYTGNQVENFGQMTAKNNFHLYNCFLSHIITHEHHDIFERAAAQKKSLKRERQWKHIKSSASCFASITQDRNKSKSCKKAQKICAMNFYRGYMNYGERKKVFLYFHFGIELWDFSAEKTSFFITWEWESGPVVGWRGWLDFDFFDPSAARWLRKLYERWLLLLMFHSWDISCSSSTTNTFALHSPLSKTCERQSFLWVLNLLYSLIAQ